MALLIQCGVEIILLLDPNPKKEKREEQIRTFDSPEWITLAIFSREIVFLSRLLYSEFAKSEPAFKYGKIACLFAAETKLGIN